MDLRLEDGQPGRATRLDGLILHLESPRAFAPGSPLRFTAEIDGDVRRFDGRSLGSRRGEGEAFHVRVRLVNLTRENRIALTAALDATSGDDPASRTPTS